MPITIHLMTSVDIGAGMEFKAQNGWNTLPEDWQRQLDLEPDGCFVAKLDERVVGTACACIFDNVTWVNLVLVDKAHRGRGIGTGLMRHVLAFLDERRVPTIRLDATPLGKPIYEKLGFTTDYELTRYEGKLPTLFGDVDAERITTASASDLPQLVQLDERITGTNRDKLIRYLYQKLMLFVFRAGEQIMGYSAVRPGSRTRHIGPCLGEPDTCLALLAAMSKLLHDDLVYMDIPEAHVQANGLAPTFGLTAQRKLTRMTRGPRVHERLDQLWCSFGPEKG